MLPELGAIWFSMTWFFYSNKAVRRDRHLPLSVMSTTEGERDKGVALLKPVYDPRGEGLDNPDFPNAKSVLNQVR